MAFIRRCLVLIALLAVVVPVDAAASTSVHGTERASAAVKIRSSLHPPNANGTITKIQWWSATAPQPGDWVAVFPVGAPDDGYLRGTVRQTHGRAAGLLNINAAPTRSGSYEHRYYNADKLVERSTPFTLEAVGTPSGQPPEPTSPPPTPTPTPTDPPPTPDVDDPAPPGNDSPVGDGALPDPADPTNLFVAPTGRGIGTILAPADLTTVLTGRTVDPGTRIWMRGGTYTGFFTSRLAGTAAAPIELRPYPGEDVVIDGRGTGPFDVALTVWGSHTIVTDLRITNSDTSRWRSQPGSLGRGSLVVIHGNDISLRNNVIHDGGTCLGASAAAARTQIYGNLIFNCGWGAPDRGHGHGIYIQNSGPTKTIEANIVLDHFGYGLHAYGSNGIIRNLDVVDNFISGAGELGGGGMRASLIGGGTPITNVRFRGNVIYDDAPAQFGYSHLGNSGLLLTDNYLASSGRGTALTIRGWREVSGSSNTTVSAGQQIALETATLDAWDGNHAFGADAFAGHRFATWRQLGRDLTGTHTTATPPDSVHIVPNRYNEGRSHVALFTWSRSPQVSLDLSEVLEPGDRFEIRNAQDYLGEPVHASTWTGRAIEIDLSSLSARLPTGMNERASTSAVHHTLIVETV